MMTTTSLDNILENAEYTLSAERGDNLHLNYEVQSEDFLAEDVVDQPVGWEYFVHGDWCRRTVSKVRIRVNC